MELLTRNYEVSEKVGEGSFSSVYRAISRKTGAKHAVKWTKKRGPSSKQKNEAEILGVLKKFPHPNIINLEEVIENENEFFLIQEWASTRDLLTHVTTRPAPLSEEEIRNYFWTILNAVEHLHSLNIAHRDLKLENIMLDEEGNLKLIDFNLSCFYTNGVPLRTFCGSVFYCPPEIVNKLPYDGPKADMWALGVLLYILCYLRFPFNAGSNPRQNPFQLNECISKAQFTFPDDDRFSDAPRGLIRSLLTRDPHLRPSASQLKNHPWFASLREAEKSDKEDSSSMGWFRFLCLM